MILLKQLNRVLTIPLALVLVMAIFMVVGAAAQFADRIAVEGWGEADGSLIAHYRIRDEEVAPSCRSENCTFQTLDLRRESFLPSASIDIDVTMQDPGISDIADPPHRNYSMSLDDQANPANAERLAERNKQMDLAHVEHEQWLEKMLEHYTPRLVIRTEDLGPLKTGDRAVILFNPAVRAHLHGNIPWEHNGYNYLFGWVKSIEPVDDSGRESLIQVTVDQTSPSNGWVGIRAGGLWAKTRQEVIKDDKTSTDVAFPKRVGLIAWPQAPGSMPLEDSVQLRELGKTNVVVAPSSVLDPRCIDSTAADAGCVWVLSGTTITPLQIGIRRRTGDSVYISERPVFLSRAIAAKDWRELSAAQRRSPPSLGGQVKLVMPKPVTMTSGMSVRSSSP